MAQAAQVKTTPDASDTSAAIEVKPTPPGPPPLLKPLANNRLRLVMASSSDIENHFAAVLPVGTEFSECLKPEYWSNHADRLRVGDVITVHADDRKFFAQL